MGKELLGGKALTNELRKLAVEQISIDDAGDPVTRNQKLAAYVWKMALGWDEDVRDEHGNLKTVHHPPVQWAIQLVWERQEGKAVVAVSDERPGMRAAETVRELARQRINGLTSSALVAAAVAKGPPKRKGAGDGA